MFISQNSDEIKEKINIDKNITTIDLYDCETSLRETYNISDNTTIYMRMIEVKEEGMKIPKVEYEIYYPFYNSKNLTKLNLTECKSKKIDILYKNKLYFIKVKKI